MLENLLNINYRLFINIDDFVYVYNLLHNNIDKSILFVGILNKNLNSKLKTI